MRCHAAEPGAVPSTVSGLTSPPYSWRTGRSVGGPRGPLPGRREARLYGPDLKGERNTSPGSGCESTRPVRKNGPVLAKHRGGAPVGERPDRKGRRLTLAR